MKSGKKALVDDTGALYMEELPESGEIKVQWGKARLIAVLENIILLIQVRFPILQRLTYNVFNKVFFFSCF